MKSVFEKYSRILIWTALAVGCIVLGISCSMIIIARENVEEVELISPEHSGSLLSDAEVKVVVYVHEPGERGAAFSNAQVIDTSSGQLLGVTNHSGLMEFTASLTSRNIRICVQAANYFPREHLIPLFSTTQVIDVKIALATSMSILVSPDDDGYTFSLGPMVYITVPIGGFKKNGTIYNDLVIVTAMYMESSNKGFLDMVDGAQFTMEDKHFGLLHFSQMHFNDPAGNELETEKINYYTEGSEQSGKSPFLVTFDQDTQSWKQLGALSSRPRQTRQTSHTLEAVGVRFSVFLGLAATITRSCWLQARTFSTATNGMPSISVPGLIVTMTQEAFVGNSQVEYRFGSNTGSQVDSEGTVNNAICLPMQCSNFSVASVFANRAITDPREPISPFDFPSNTFSREEVGPTIIGRFFSIQDVITARPGNPRPFYESSSECLANAGEQISNADYADFFSFIETTLPAPPSTQNCYVKIVINECLEKGPVFVTVQATDSINATLLSNRIEEVNFVETGNSSEFNNTTGCSKSEQVVCIPYVCNAVVSVQVSDGDTSEFCNISALAPVLYTPQLTRTSANDLLLIQSQMLVTRDYNNLDLGLYFNANSTIAEELCLVANRSSQQSFFDGHTSTFNCISNIIKNSEYKVENETVQLNCTSTSTGFTFLQYDIQITWKFISKTTEIIYPFSSMSLLDKYSVITDRQDPLFGQLTIQSVELDNNGVYECSVEGTSFITKVDLQVHGKKLIS